MTEAGAEQQALPGVTLLGGAVGPGSRERLPYRCLAPWLTALGPSDEAPI